MPASHERSGRCKSMKTGLWTLDQAAVLGVGTTVDPDEDVFIFGPAVRMDRDRQVREDAPIEVAVHGVRPGDPEPIPVELVVREERFDRILDLPVVDVAETGVDATLCDVAQGHPNHSVRALERLISCFEDERLERRLGQEESYQSIQHVGFLQSMNPNLYYSIFIL